MQSQPIPMYITEETHFGQVTQKNLNSIPSTATIQTAMRSRIPGLSRNGNQAHRGIGAGNQYEDAHVVQTFQPMVANFIQIKCVIGCAGAVQQNHAQHENAHGNQRPKRCTAEGSVNQKERGGDDGHQESDKMSQRTDGIFGAEYRAVLRCLGAAGNGIGGIR